MTATWHDYEVALSKRQRQEDYENAHLEERGWAALGRPDLFAAPVADKPTVEELIERYANAFRVTWRQNAIEEITEDTAVVESMIHSNEPRKKARKPAAKRGKKAAQKKDEETYKPEHGHRYDCRKPSMKAIMDRVRLQWLATGNTIIPTTADQHDCYKLDCTLSIIRVAIYEYIESDGTHMFHICTNHCPEIGVRRESHEISGRKALMENVYVCEKTGIVHICGSPACTACAEVSGDGESVCRLTGVVLGPVLLHGFIPGYDEHGNPLSVNLSVQYSERLKPKMHLDDEDARAERLKDKNATVLGSYALPGDAEYEKGVIRFYNSQLCEWTTRNFGVINIGEERTMTIDTFTEALRQSRQANPAQKRNAVRLRFDEGRKWAFALLFSRERETKIQEILEYRREKLEDMINEYIECSRRTHKPRWIEECKRLGLKHTPQLINIQYISMFQQAVEADHPVPINVPYTVGMMNRIIDYIAIMIDQLWCIVLTVETIQKANKDHPRVFQPDSFAQAAISLFQTGLKCRMKTGEEIQLIQVDPIVSTRLLPHNVMKSMGLITDKFKETRHTIVKMLTEAIDTMSVNPRDITMFTLSLDDLVNNQDTITAVIKEKMEVHRGLLANKG